MKRLAAALTVIGVAFGVLAIGNTAFADNAIMGDFTTTYGGTSGKLLDLPYQQCPVAESVWLGPPRKRLQLPRHRGARLRR